MSRIAVLLVDLQIDFLDTQKGRMPVGEAGAARVIAAARSVLDGTAIPGAIPVFIVNAFPRSHRVANLFRNNAAIAGSEGAALDPRVALPTGTPLFSKVQGNAFSNLALHSFLQSQSVTKICVIGVFAEGCVRATAIGAKALGYDVCVPIEAIATNARWKLWFAKHSLRTHGVQLPSCLVEASGEA